MKEELDKLTQTLLKTMKDGPNGVKLFKDIIEKINSDTQSETEEFDLNNTKDKNGIAPLHFASQYGNQELISTIFLMVNNINVEDKEGNNAAHFAATNKTNPAVINALEALGINLQHTNKEGDTPLLLAAAKGNVETVKGMLGHSTLDDDTIRAELAVKAATNPDIAVIKYLTQNNIIDVHKCNAKAIYPVHKACDLPMLKFLVNEQKVDINVIDKQGRIPLFNTTDSLHKFNFLLEKGADVTHQDKEGRTVAHFVVNSNNSFILEVLHKVNPEILNKKNWVQIQTANQKDYHEVIDDKEKFLIVEDATPLHVAMSAGKLNVIKLLLSTGDIHMPDAHGRSAVVRAVDTNKPDHMPIKILIEHVPEVKSKMLWITTEVIKGLQVSLENIGPDNRKYSAPGPLLLTPLREIYKVVFKELVQHDLLLGLNKETLIDMFKAIEKNYETLGDKKKVLPSKKPVEEFLVDPLKEFWQNTLGEAMKSIANLVKPVIKSKATSTKDKTSESKDKKIYTEEEIKTAEKTFSKCQEMILFGQSLKKTLGEEFEDKLENYALIPVKMLQKTNQDLIESTDILAKMSMNEVEQKDGQEDNVIVTEHSNKQATREESNQILSLHAAKSEEMDIQVQEDMVSVESKKDTVPVKMEEASALVKTVSHKRLATFASDEPDSKDQRLDHGKTIMDKNSEQLSQATTSSVAERETIDSTLSASSVSMDCIGVESLPSSDSE